MLTPEEKVEQIELTLKFSEGTIEGAKAVVAGENSVSLRNHYLVKMNKLVKEIKKILNK